jgi:5-methylcytosine-specific restriction endonuclease McrA
MRIKPSQRERKKYCNRECKTHYTRKNPPNQHLKTGENVGCKTCNKIFYVKKCNLETNKYCSKICLHIDIKKSENDNKKGKHKAICEECKKDYFVKKYRLNDTKFCSRECLGKSNGRKAKILLTKKIEVKCTQCNNEILKKRSVIKNMNFCDTNCMQIYYLESRMFKGENNGAWTGGKPGYYGENWLKRKREIRKRDKYKCKFCGIPEENYKQKLSIHHKKIFKDFNGDWEKANEKKNLIAVCEHCHRKIHSTLNKMKKKKVNILMLKKKNELKKYKAY